MSQDFLPERSAGPEGCTDRGRYRDRPCDRAGAGPRGRRGRGQFQAVGAEAKETTRLAERAGARALTVQADVTQEAQVRAMVDQIARELGGLDHLVNNAGWTQRVPHRCGIGS